MSNFLISEMAMRFAMPFKAVKKDMTEIAPGIIHFPSLVPRLGKHYFHCAVDLDGEWLQVVGAMFKSKRPPIFTTFDRVSQSLTANQRKVFVVFLQTAFGLFSIYRAHGYAGQGGAFLHPDKDGIEYVVEPFEHWFKERTGLWIPDGDDPAPFDER